MAALEVLVRESVAGWDARLEQALFATTDPAVVAAHLQRFCRRVVGEPVDALLYRPGVGIVAGFALADGREVVVKVHRWHVSGGRLAAVAEVQRHAADAGLPAPRPLAGPLPLGRGFATVEEHRPGGTADGHRPRVRASLVAGLHRLVEASRGLGHVDVGRPAMYRDPGAPLWPEPHSVRFDFDATAGGAAWIDAVAADARARLDPSSGPTVVAHFDWRVGNLAFADDEVTAIYDWDSIAAAPEAAAVGMNAAQFSADWAGGADDPLPSLDEMAAFVDEYEAVRGARFAPAERRQLDAANLALIAYGARCQHSDLRLHPEIAGSSTSRWLRLLRERGDHFFDR